MKRMRIAMLGLAAVFAMSLVWSASAFAKSTNNPQYEIEEGGVAKILAAPAEKPETRVVEAEQSGVQKLEGSGVVLACKKLKLKAGATIIGSNKPNAGKSAETLEYSECEVEGSPNCEINKEKAGKAKLTTNALTDTLVFATKKAAEEEVAPTDTLFEPTTGKEFISFELSGTCLITGKVKVEGSVAAENPEGDKLKETHEIKAPKPAIKEVFVNKAGVTTKKAVSLKAFGAAATYVGNSTVKVKDSGKTKFINWRIFN